MKFKEGVPVYGDVKFRGECPKEDIEQISFFNWLRREYPEYGAVAIHPKNEEKRSGGKFYALQKDKAMGLVPGASDIVIPASPSFVCEMKRQDHTKSRWQKGQPEYLEAAKKLGAFVAVALGFEAAKEAFEAYIKWTKEHNTTD